MKKLEKPIVDYFSGVRSGCNYRIDTGLMELIREISKCENRTISDVVQILLSMGLLKYFDDGFGELKDYFYQYKYADHFISLGINQKSSNGLCRAGYKHISELKDLDLDDLLKINAVGYLGAAQILNAVNKYYREKDVPSE